MARRSLFDKLWKHGAEIPVVFPGMLENVVTKFSQINNAPREVAAANINSMLAKMEDLFKWGIYPLMDAIDGLPPSLVSMRARESFRVSDYPWGGEAGINVLDSAAYSGMSAVPIIAKEFDTPPRRLRGRELRTAIIGSWLRNGRAFTSGGVRPVRDAEFSDPGARAFAIGLSTKSYGSKIMDEFIVMKGSNEEIDNLVAEKLVEEEGIIESDDDLEAKVKKKHLNDTRSSMRLVLERRYNTRFLWKFTESSDPGVRSFAARKWAADTISHVENRLAGGGKKNRAVLEKLFEPAMADGRASREIEKVLSPNSSSVIVSQTLTSMRASRRQLYCDVFSVLSSSKNVVIRGGAERALRDDCPASRF